MIGLLRGKLHECASGAIVLFVGEQFGVGYSLNVPKSDRYTKLTLDSVQTFHTHTHHKEDQFELFGFLTRLEVDVFKVLLTVNGIGPRAALSILSHSEPKFLFQALLESDKDYLKNIPGIGKKTAERMIIDLRSVVEKRFGAAGSQAVEISSGLGEGALAAFEEARAALVELGFKEAELSKVLKRLGIGASTAGQYAGSYS